MAVQGLSGLSAVLNLKFSDPITATLRRDVALLNLIGVVPKANSSATWGVKIGARTTAAAKAQGYDVQSSDYSSDARQQATLAWAHYEAYAAVTGTAQRISQANGSAAVSNDILGEELNDAAQELAVKVSTHLYSGDVSATPVEVAGVAVAIDSSGNYAGIDASTYTTWVSAEATGSLSTLTLDNIRTNVFRPVLDATGKRPTAVVLPGALHDKVAALVDPSQRILRPVNSPLGMVDLASMGFVGFQLDGVPFIEDRHCTSNTMYGLTLDQLEIQQVPPAWTTMDPGQLSSMLKELSGQVIDPALVLGMMQQAQRKLSFQVNALSKTGDSSKLQLVGDFQLCVKRRNAFSKYTLS